MNARVAAVAGGLREAGIGPGGYVAWQRPNSVESVVLFRACWRLGAVAVPIHHQAGAHDRAAMLRPFESVLGLDGPLPSGDPVSEVCREPDPTAVVLFTSGSSGAPKGVIHTQERL
ncbi:MAG: fatty-acyl-CoA synthase, partial [Acidimicrobiaceae bacterium]